jgi:hypothetical protein
MGKEGSWGIYAQVGGHFFLFNFHLVVIGFEFIVRV